MPNLTLDTHPPACTLGLVFADKAASRHLCCCPAAGGHCIVPRVPTHCAANGPKVLCARHACAVLWVDFSAKPDMRAPAAGTTTGPPAAVQMSKEERLKRDVRTCAAANLSPLSGLATACLTGLLQYPYLEPQSFCCATQMELHTRWRFLLRVVLEVAGLVLCRACSAPLP